MFVAVSLAIGAEQIAPEIRVIYQDNAITIQHQIMQPGEVSGYHSHSGNEIEVLLSKARVSVWDQPEGDEPISPKVIEVAEGEIVWIPPTDVPHNYENIGTEPIETILVTIEPRTD